MVNWDSLVEAKIDTIRVDSMNKEVRIELTCAWAGKDRKQIVAIGVDDFLVNEMRLENIVDRISLYDSNDAKGEGAEVSRLIFLLMRGMEPRPSDHDWPALQERVKCVRDGVLSLLQVEQVSGASVLVLARSFRLDPID